MQYKKFYRAQKIANKIKIIQEYIIIIVKQAQDRYKKNANDKRSDAPIYKKKDLIILNIFNLIIEKPLAKLIAKQEKLFEIK